MNAQHALRWIFKEALYNTGVRLSPCRTVGKQIVRSVGRPPLTGSCLVRQRPANSGWQTSLGSGW